MLPFQFFSLTKIIKVFYSRHMSTLHSEYKGRSLLNWIDWKAEEILELLELSIQVKKEAQNGTIFSRFQGKTIALLFEKRSTRTRCAFETAFGEEGGHPVFLSNQDIQLGAKETIQDTARVLGRMFSAIQFRGFSQKHVEILAKYSGVPVYNGLTDDFHPTQALADVMTLYEHFKTIKGLEVAYCGHGNNNVARSLLLICAKLGIHIRIISPVNFLPDEQIKKIVTPFAEKSGAKLEYSSDISLVKNADAVYTDVWASMGEESQKDERKKILSPYQVNEALLAKTGKNTIFLHCLPAIRGEEVTDAVIDGQQSLVWNQAENRKHTIKAIMLATI